MPYKDKEKQKEFQRKWARNKGPNSWLSKKIELLHEADRHRNAKALLAEFDEWINIPEGTEELDYLCLEDNEWTDEQEVDVKNQTS